MSDALRPHGLEATKLFYPQDSPGKNTAACHHFPLQGISLPRAQTLGPLHWRVDSLPLSHQGSQRYLVSPQFWTKLSSVHCRKCITRSPNLLILRYKHF